MRTRLLGLAARQLSTGAVLPLIERAERADAHTYALAAGVTYGVGRLIGASVS